ncbi:MAG TPA: AraC family transcriptional regulator ligand-binding domain-containing protein [Caulobacteraceae bacterium]|jgi:AraC-like DNA-binding protein
MSYQDPARDAVEALVPGTFLGAFVAAAKAVDLDPYRQLRQLGLPTTDHDDEALVAPYSRFMELLARCAEASGYPDFTLRVVKHVSLASLGAGSALALAQPTLRAGLLMLCTYGGNPARRQRPTLEEHDGAARIRLGFRRVPEPALARAPAFGLGVALRAIQGLIGDDWRPRRAEFSCPAPEDVAAYRELFGEVAFEQPFDALIFDRAELDRPLATADPDLSRVLELVLGQLGPPKPPPFADEVRELIVGLLPRGLCSIDRVASHLGVDRRTVHRRLALAGVAFTDLVDEARRAIVQAQFEDANRPIAAVASALGFANQSSFTRWFRGAYGVTPKHYRKT